MYDACAMKQDFKLHTKMSGTSADNIPHDKVRVSTRQDVGKLIELLFGEQKVEGGHKGGSSSGSGSGDYAEESHSNQSEVESCDTLKVDTRVDFSNRYRLKRIPPLEATESGQVPRPTGFPTRRCLHWRKAHLSFENLFFIPILLGTRGSA